MESLWEYSSKRVRVLEGSVFNYDDYERFIDSTILVQYAFTDENGPYGNCTMIDKCNSVLNCTYVNGRMDGLLVTTRYDELISVYEMKNGRVNRVVELFKLQRYHFVDLPSFNESCWEGDVLDGIPYGWGEVVDFSNRPIYTGFRIGNQNVCYGTTYYPDTGIIEYEGNWCFGKRWGHGRCFSPEGILEYEGDWLDNKKVVIEKVMIDNDSLRLYSMHSQIKDLIIGDDCCQNSNKLLIKNYSHLQRLSIGNSSFIDVHSFILYSLPELKCLELGDHTCENVMNVQFSHLPHLKVIKLGTFSIKGRQIDTIPSEPFNYQNRFLLEDIPSLDSIVTGELFNFIFIGIITIKDVHVHNTMRLGKDAFKYVYSAVVENSREFEKVIVHHAGFLYQYCSVPYNEFDLSQSLTELYLSDYCGNNDNMEGLSFSRFRDLRSLSIGYWSFLFMKKVDISELPKLESIMIRGYSFSKTNCERSMVIIRDCPSLTTVEFEDSCCYSFNSLSIQNLPQLTKCSFGLHAFERIHTVTFTSLPVLRTFQLCRYALNGDVENVKKTHMNELKNKCVLKELPLLEKIDCEVREEVLCYVGVVLAVDVPVLMSVGSEVAFKHVHSWKCRNSDGLEEIIQKQTQFIQE